MRQKWEPNPLTTEFIHWYADTKGFALAVVFAACCPNIKTIDKRFERVSQNLETSYDVRWFNQVLNNQEIKLWADKLKAAPQPWR